ncbi:MAG: quinohemoprotein amine dehydrogenase subunit alpha [Bryobacteraceae bacterium]
MKPLAFLALAAAILYSQQPADSAKLADAEKNKEEIEQGTPISSDLVRNACGACHKSDDKLRMSRISYRRTTPEGWERTIKRMVSLNGVHLEPAQAREILKYLSNNLGLAPEEVKPGAFEVEQRMIEYKYAADKDTETTCTKCHSFGRVLLQRRTKTEWELLIAMHRGYYPLSDFQAFRRMNPIQTQPGPDGRPPDNRHPMEKAIAHLSTAFPLKTPEWSAWSANMRAPKLAGRWAVSGYQPGMGPVYGVVEIKASPQAEDEFTTRSHLIYARTSQKLERAGKGLVYTGFEWRGRSGTEKEATREVMFVDRNMREIAGRWYSGAYDEIGMDMKLQRIGNDPVVLGLDRIALKTGAAGLPINIHGVNLKPDAIDFGHGVKVARVVSAAPDLIKVEVNVDKDAAVGARDVFVAGAVLPAGAVVYDKIDSIKVTPQAGMARIGGINFPKQYQQFEAIAYSNGPDSKPDTKDDLNLGPVDVAWSIEEYTATFGDDDKDYVGTLDDNGLFTPNVDGPNPKRHNHADNYGDVWVVATYSKEGRPIRGRAHLLVTVPLYMRWGR